MVEATITITITISSGNCPVSWSRRGSSSTQGTIDETHSSRNRMLAVQPWNGPAVAEIADGASPVTVSEQPARDRLAA